MRVKYLLVFLLFFGASCFAADQYFLQKDLLQQVYFEIVQESQAKGFEYVIVRQFAIQNGKALIAGACLGVIEDGEAFTVEKGDLIADVVGFFQKPVNEEAINVAGYLIDHEMRRLVKHQYPFTEWHNQ